MTTAQFRANLESAALTKLLMAAEWATRAASMRGPAGTTVYFVGPEYMAALKAAVEDMKYLMGTKAPRRKQLFAWADAVKQKADDYADLVRNNVPMEDRP